MEKLRLIAREMFAEAPKFEPDHFSDSKDDDVPPGGTTTEDSSTGPSK